jgi:hypothetical protein
VGIYAVRRERARPTLHRMRSWIAGHNSYLTAGMLLVVGVLQVVKGVGQL